MIQRIQTLYLLISFALFASLFLLPFAHFISGGDEYVLLYRGFESNGKMILITYPVAILQTIIAAVTFITILLYKRRTVQMRLIIFNMICMLGFMGLVFFNIYKQEVELKSVTYGIANIFPLIAFILHFMAFKAIRKDENLIRSMDRIR